MLVICAALVPYLSGHKGESIIISRALRNAIICMPNSFSIRRKHFAGNFSACVITNNEYI